MITQEQVHNLLDYDPETGVFIWRKSPAQCVKAGSVAGTLHADGYVRITIKRKGYLAHRLAWFYVHGEWPAETLDHEKGERKTAAIKALREATWDENRRNRKTNKNNKLGLKGVHWYAKTKKFKAQISVLGKVLYLGQYETKEAAHAAYVAAAKKHHGAFANDGINPLSGAA